MRGRTEVPRDQRGAVSAAFAAQGLGFAVLVTHLPDFTDRYSLSDLGVTLLLFLVTVLAGGGSVLSEALARHASSGTALRVGLGGAAVALTIVTVAPGLPVATCGFALYGLAVGAVDATSNMQAVAVQHRYGRSIITSFHAWWSAAAIAGALLVAGGGAIGLGLATSILPVAFVELLVAVLIGPCVATHDQEAEQAEQAEMAGAGGSDAPVGGPDLGWRPILLLGAALTCFWAVDSGISNWSTLYLHDIHRAGNAAALGYAAYQVTGLLSRLGGDRVVRRFGSAATVRVAGLIAFAGTLVVIGAPSAPVAVLGFAITGIGLPVVAPLCFTAAASAARLAGQGDRATIETAIARLNVFNYAGSLIGAAAVGGVAAVTTLRWGFLVSLLLAATVVVLAPSFRTDDERSMQPG